MAEHEEQEEQDEQEEHVLPERLRRPWPHSLRLLLADEVAERKTRLAHEKGELTTRFVVVL